MLERLRLGLGEDTEELLHRRGVHSLGGALQVGGDLFIGRGGRLGAVPRPPVGVGLGIGHLSQRPVNQAAIPAGAPW